MNKRGFIITAIVSFFIVIITTGIILTKGVASFDLLGNFKRDCVPYNVFVSKVDMEYSVNISWLTKGKCIGFIIYGNERDSLNSVGVDLENSVKSREHRVVLEKLVASDNYYFLINSEEKSYGFNDSQIEFSLGNL
jgi:hypothetical protein